MKRHKQILFLFSLLVCLFLLSLGDHFCKLKELHTFFFSVVEMLKIYVASFL